MKKNTNTMNTTGKIVKSIHSAIKHLIFWGGIGVFGLSLSTIIYQGMEDNFQAALIQSETFIDPLQGQVQCSETDEVTLQISGGSPIKTWEFIGEGINGVFGELSDGRNQISQVGEILKTDQLIVSYKGPPATRLNKLGTVFVKVRDTVLRDLQTGEPQEKIFTLNVTPSCIETIRFVDPDPNQEHIAQKGVAFDMNRIEAKLYNGDIIRYGLPQPDIGFFVTPTGGGSFEGNSFFTFLNTGKAFIQAFLSENSKAARPNFLVKTSPLQVNIGAQNCQLTATIFEGQGGSGNNLPNSFQPSPIERHFFSGETWVVRVDNGLDRFLWTSTNNAVATVEPLSTNFGQQVESSEVIAAEVAVIRAVGPGQANIIVTSRDGCTAFLTVFVDIFPAKIRFAKLEGVAGLARGTKRNLLVEVEHKGGIENVARLQTILVKGRINSPEEIVNKEVFDIIDIETAITTQSTIPVDPSDPNIPVDPKLQSFTRLYRVPIAIPEALGVTDGRYSLLVTASDRNATGAGILESFTILPLQVGAGVPGDLNKDNKVDIADVVFMFRSLSEKTPATEAFTLQDIISLLRQITNQ